MSCAEASLLLGAVALLLIGGLIFWAVIRRSRHGLASEAVARGAFRQALRLADAGPGAPRDDLLAAATAARHLLKLTTATRLLDRLLDDEPADDEARLDRGLVAAYGGDSAGAHAALDTLELSDPEETVPLPLLRAWLLLRDGDEAEAHALFEQVEVAIDTLLHPQAEAGDPLAAEWLAVAADLYRSKGNPRRAERALGAARQAAPSSPLIQNWPPSA